MTDWLATMQQTYEYYIVDPGTWKDVKRLDNVVKSSINRDSSKETLGSATIDITGTMEECYIRIYLITIQNGIREKYPLGTFLVQTPSYKFDGKVQTASLDAYTPLLELKESPPPLGYSLLEGDNIMERAYTIIRDKARAPVIRCIKDDTLNSDFVANVNDTWITFLSDLIANAKCSFGLDEMGRILFNPIQDTASLQPVWTFDDSNSSILYPEVDISHDLYGIPNVVEVVYSSGNTCFSSRAVNDDKNSPTSTVNRGREIVHRESNPSFPGEPTQEYLDDYAKQVLKEKSTLEFTISYTHGYCPVRLGDCVRLNYKKAGLNGVKAKVISQSIDCVSGCPVTEKAVFTNRLWG